MLKPTPNLILLELAKMGVVPVSPASKVRAAWRRVGRSLARLCA